MAQSFLENLDFEHLPLTSDPDLSVLMKLTREIVSFVSGSVVVVGLKKGNSLNFCSIMMRRISCGTHDPNLDGHHKRTSNRNIKKKGIILIFKMRFSPLNALRWLGLRLRK